VPTDSVLIGHDYISKWGSPGTVIQLDYRGKHLQGVQIEFYTGNKRWFSGSTFKITFSHYQDCIKCNKGE
jgi:hypothetical protein